jgi:hypothetical protein
MLKKRGKQSREERLEKKQPTGNLTLMSKKRISKIRTRN